MNMAELPNRTIQEQGAGELSEKTASFVSKIRDTLAEEAKLTFTLPRFGYGIAKDLAMKAYGFGAVGLWTKIATDQPSNELLDSGKEIALTTGFASSMALAGLAVVIWANRMHKGSNQEQEEYQEQVEQAQLRQA